MKNYKYVIIDDDDMDRLSLSFYLKNYTFLEHCASFSSSLEGIEYIMNNKIDIAFIDIKMPHINGLDAQKRIRENVLCTIFITAYAEYAIEGFNLEAFDFLIKPFNQERLKSCLCRVQEYFEIKHKADLFDVSFKKDSIMVKEGYNHVSLLVYEIVYMEALKDYTKLISLNKKTTTIHCNLGGMLKKDHFKDFIRIHKSFAIQKNYIQTIKSNEIILVNNITLPIGLNYKKVLLNTLS